MGPIKIKAIELREAGYSYSIIGEKLSVPKSTLSNWLANIAFVPNREVIKKIGQAKLKSALYKQELKFNSIKGAKERAKLEISNISKRDLLFLGIGLYLGEGEKTFENVRIVNSDPRIIRLAIKWFREIFGAEVKNFKPYLHSYPDIDTQVVLRFWSKATGIPVNQFGKTTIDTRLNKSRLKNRKLPYGTLHLRVNSGGNRSLGVELHRKIIAWIERCID